MSTPKLRAGLEKDQRDWAVNSVPSEVSGPLKYMADVIIQSLLCDEERRSLARHPERSSG
jgi:hypothetical protein